MHKNGSNFRVQSFRGPERRGWERWERVHFHDSLIKKAVCYSGGVGIKASISPPRGRKAEETVCGMWGNIIQNDKRSFNHGISSVTLEGNTLANANTHTHTYCTHKAHHTHQKKAVNVLAPLSGAMQQVFQSTALWVMIAVMCFSAQDCG